MPITKKKLRFLRWLIKHRLIGQPKRCPYCGESVQFEYLGKKKILIDIIRCTNCSLIFRYPADSVTDNAAYYQKEYSSGPVTDMPDEAYLQVLKRNNFQGSSLERSPKIHVLQAIKNSGVVLDYGCSWGYAVYQLCNKGYQAFGFEISQPRAEFGRQQLGVEICCDPRQLHKFPKGSIDIIFTNHTLEHLPNLHEVLELFCRLLAPNGMMYHVLPNFTGKSARAGLFWSWIGEEHPIAPTMDFFERNLPTHGFNQVVCASGPFDDVLVDRIRMQQWDQLPMEGDELLVLAWKSSQ
jgi:SAM-dependent methyltransferase